MFDASGLICTDVREASLELLGDEEISRLSVCRISSSATFESDGSARVGGLYDPSMGSMDQKQHCFSCGCRTGCPGHLGHIRLALPIFHPTLMSGLVKLLKMICFRCKRLRVGVAASAITVKKFQLIQNDMLEELDQFEKLSSKAVTGGMKVKAAQGRQAMGSLGGGGGGKNTEAGGGAVVVAEGIKTDRRMEMMKLFEKLRVRQEERMKKANDEGRGEVDICLDISQTSVTVESWKKLKKEYMSASAVKKLCTHCSMSCEASVRVNKLSTCIEVSWPWGRPVPFSSSSWKDFKKTDKDGKDKSILEETELNVDEKLKVYGKGGRVVGRCCLQAFQLSSMIKELWESADREILEFLFPMTKKKGWGIFFIQNLPVAANRFRPLGMPTIPGGPGALHPRTGVLLDVLRENEKIVFALSILNHPDPLKALSDPAFYRDMTGLDLTTISEEDKAKIRKTVIDHTQSDAACIVSYCSAMQQLINSYIDKTKAEKPLTAPPGIRQWIERKQGAIRQKMMGKRVNYAARTVIAPDCYINTNEIGVPIEFAIKLTIPECVTYHNIAYLRKLVENGPFKYPGANSIQDSSGNTFNLEALSVGARRAKARMLLTNDVEGAAPRVVFRHLRNGDVVLMNRQPTLHKPGIMAHFVRILTGQKTFRLNYVNCNTYNADFDGDEMNMHLPQDVGARAEARLIANADAQFTVPKNGEPLRGLIQDHVQGGTFLTSRNTFLTITQYQTLVYAALTLFVDRGQKMIINGPEASRVFTNNACVYSPSASEDFVYATGVDPYEQFMSSENFAIVVDPPTVMKPQKLWTGKQGVLDKAQFGSSSYGLSHLIFELFGPRGAGLILNSFARTFTTFLQMRGTSCCPADFLLTPEGEEKREQLIHRVTAAGTYLQEIFVDNLYRLMHWTEPAPSLSTKKPSSSLPSSFASKSRITDRIYRSKINPSEYQTFRLRDAIERHRYDMRGNVSGLPFPSSSSSSVASKGPPMMSAIEASHLLEDFQQTSEFFHVPWIRKSKSEDTPNSSSSSSSVVSSASDSQIKKKNVDTLISSSSSTVVDTEDNATSSSSLVSSSSSIIPSHWGKSILPSPYPRPDGLTSSSNSSSSSLMLAKGLTSPSEALGFSPYSVNSLNLWEASRLHQIPLFTRDWRTTSFRERAQHLRELADDFEALGNTNNRVREVLLERLSTTPELSLYFPKLSRMLGTDRLWGDGGKRCRSLRPTVTTTAKTDIPVWTEADMGIETKAKNTYYLEMPPPPPPGYISVPEGNKWSGLANGKVLEGDGSLRVPKLYNPSWLWNTAEGCHEDNLSFYDPRRYVTKMMKSNKKPRKMNLRPTESTRLRLEHMLTNRFKGKEEKFYRMIDGFFQSAMGGVSSKNNDLVTGSVTLYKFPNNGFASMVLTGAKGSKVNYAMICGMLSQQSLEGKRVPIMVSGKTLPSFARYDFGARAGGLITDRFLTGLRPQEYFFHCMSGREGLVDTAVKTAKSGYLQRCVLKSLEGIVAQYDGTVRDSDGTIMQFVYGEDGLDVPKTPYLDKMDDIMKNPSILASKLKVDESMSNPHVKRSMRMVDDFLKKQRIAEMEAKKKREEEEGKVKESKEEVKEEVKEEGEDEKKERKKKEKQKRKEGGGVFVEGYEKGVIDILDPISGVYPPSGFVGSVSEAYRARMEEIIASDSFGHYLSEKNEEKRKAKKSQLRSLLLLKYNESVTAAGDAVGCLAAQSIGEPATQMTLNTFHLAGHGAANVTLGIPRLREILQTAGRSSTPFLYVPLKGETEDELSKNAVIMMRGFRKIHLTDVIHAVGVEANVYSKRPSSCTRETFGSSHNFETYWQYEASIQFENLDHFCAVVPLHTPKRILSLVCSKVLPDFMKQVLRYMVLAVAKQAGHSVEETHDEVSEFFSKFVADDAGQMEYKEKADRLKEIAKTAGTTAAMGRLSGGGGGDGGALDSSDVMLGGGGVGGRLMTGGGGGGGGGEEEEGGGGEKGGKKGKEDDGEKEDEGVENEKDDEMDGDSDKEDDNSEVDYSESELGEDVKKDVEEEGEEDEDEEMEGNERKSRNKKVTEEEGSDSSGSDDEEEEEEKTGKEKKKSKEEKKKEKEEEIARRLIKSGKVAKMKASVEKAKQLKKLAARSRGYNYEEILSKYELDEFSRTTKLEDIPDVFPTPVEEDSMWVTTDAGSRKLLPPHCKRKRN